ncbi:MAG: hypothetical protein M1837_001354 [Sclerophora amabilis]|nr:MAG: hypothetical protein M1837_001354 [Sclerophora amabilis]
MLISASERRLCDFLGALPKVHHNRYSEVTRRELLERLFWSLADHNDGYIRQLFPHGPPVGPAAKWELREAQGALEGAEYSPAARGKPCGHIFKSGEATYRCKTCTIDDTCVLCSRCFDASDHTGHMIFVSVSPGNTGCCDCGDPEAWRLPVNCAIHTAIPDQSQTVSSENNFTTGLPEPLVTNIKMTIARAFDYICDVISCSPEQLRLPKTENSIRLDEKMSRLSSKYYPSDEGQEEFPEYALVLWNDEKHTVTDVKEQVARACKERKQFGMDRAIETNDIGRSIVKHDRDISNLLRISKIIEEIKVTVTIRSSRDTFREQMCGTIMEWLVDIAGCSVGEDHNLLRQTICEEMLKAWRTGSEASNAAIGKRGIDDHEKDEESSLRRIHTIFNVPARVEVELADDHDPDEDEGNDANEEFDDGDDDEEDDEDEMELDLELSETLDSADGDGDGDGDGDLEMDNVEEPGDETEMAEATYAGYPPPPPPPPPPAPARRQDPDQTPSDSDTADNVVAPNTLPRLVPDIPKTPANKFAKPHRARPPKYWLEKPPDNGTSPSLPLEEDLSKRVRLDWMIMFDLRLWKKARIDLRDLYITTVVTIPRFKRILTLRFAGLYTTLAQLYLIADREPDHSIINLSLQMLTTPSITYEVVERGNFLTNLMAILYTFLTTRQVGHPQDVQPNATLAFDAGSLTNRRMYHFFMDLRYLFGSEHVQEKLRTQDRYQMQFLDLVKLHQGICPNVRAVGDHVEYETDAWISASLITRELNRLCRQFAESFKWRRGQAFGSVSRAIRRTAKVAIINSMGLERRRFDQAEIRQEARFKKLGNFEFDTREWGVPNEYRVVKFVVEKEHISFHHALHYTLSWLIDGAKSVTRDQLRGLMLFSAQELRAPKSEPFLPSHEYEDCLLIMFDFPLRVCAWLAQMKAGMWVRNGLSLRHQMSTYRGVSQRDVAHHRDVFLLQSALVICDPSRVLASMIDRFGMDDWMKGKYEVRQGYDQNQVIDVAEDFIHLMIVLLSDRISLLPVEDEPNAQVLGMKRDIAHVLCFRPLSFSDLTARLAEKVQDMEEFQDVLSDMTKFRPPEGLSDSGTFELKEQCFEEIDPYIAHYSKNQREESENAYRSRMSKRTGKPAAEVVFEPNLLEIRSGIFTDLAAFTRTNLFIQIIYYSLNYPLNANHWVSVDVPDTRLETFLHVVLHLVLLAVTEDKSQEDEASVNSPQSFVSLALVKTGKTDDRAPKTISTTLQRLLSLDQYRTCHPKIKHILRRMHQKKPRTFLSMVSYSGLQLDRMETESPASTSSEELERKKKVALDRQAKVMAQFQQQRKNFLDNQGDIDWGEDDFSDLEAESETLTGEHRKMWKYPTGTCILCQEETNDSRIYGTFAMIADSNILRQTDIKDPEFVQEAATTPADLDCSADEFRPFGASKKNREVLRKLDSEGKEFIDVRQGLGTGFPSGQVRRGPVTTGCGHIMHYSCFELYYAAVTRRQTQQISRAHPETIDKKEFVCPLCKALGNAFLPIIWKGKEELFPGALQTETSFDDWLTSEIGPIVSRLEKAVEVDGQERQRSTQYPEIFANYSSDTIIAPIASRIDQLVRSNDPTSLLRGQANANLGSFLLSLDPSINAPAPSHPTNLELVAPMELASIYKRLRETLRKNNLETCFPQPPTPLGLEEDFTYTDTLAKTLGFSIAAMEIAQRGIQSEPGTTLLDKIPQQSLTSIRILSETVSSYFAIGGLRHGGANKTITEFSDMQRRQIRQLLVGHPQIFDSGIIPTQGSKVEEPLLSQDAFNFLAQSSVCMVPALHLDVHHVLCLCYIAEIVTVTLAFIGEGEFTRHFSQPNNVYRDISGDMSQQFSADQLQSFKSFVDSIADMANSARSTDYSSGLCLEFLPLLRSLVSSYALPFLRKSVILLHSRYGVDFLDTGFADIGKPEIDRLTSALRLPSLEAIFASFTTPARSSTIMYSIISGWIRHWILARVTAKSYNKKLEEQSSAEDVELASKMNEKKKSSRAPFEDEFELSLAHPAIYELVALPKNFDTLSEEAMRRRCPTTGKDISDPNICLFCGDIFCGQAFCCSKEGRLGGCNQHVQKCGRNVGLFINIRKCTVLYLHESRGSWNTAPYLDRHGEVDTGLRRNRQLFLNQRRYDALLRNVWLHHAIPTTISRKLESDINNGGWETI